MSKDLYVVFLFPNHRMPRYMVHAIQIAISLPLHFNSKSGGHVEPNLDQLL